MAMIRNIQNLKFLIHCSDIFSCLTNIIMLEYSCGFKKIN